MRCPHCKNHVMQKAADGQLSKLRTHGPIAYDRGQWRTRCHWCKSEVVLPLSIEELPAQLRERYILSIKRD